MVELGVELPRVAAVDLVLYLRLLGEQGVEVGVGLGEARRDDVEAVEQVAHLAHPVLHVLAHGLRRVEVGLLLEQADRCVRRQLGRAGRRLFSAATMIRSSVDLPAPFVPRTPILAPGRNESEIDWSTWRSAP